MLATLALASLGQSASPRSSAFRCQNRHKQCAEWAGRGECNNNIDYMVEKCPAACDFCTNAGLEPTPARFELDYVCDGKIGMSQPSQEAMEMGLPDGCAFHCRDNMPEECTASAAKGACTAHPGSARAACPASCGVCKALDMPTSAPDAYPRPSCGDSSEHCADWASRGECVANFLYMKNNCGLRCGFCTPPSEKPAPTKKKTKEKKKKKKKSKGSSEDSSKDEL